MPLVGGINVKTICELKKTLVKHTKDHIRTSFDGSSEENRGSWLTQMQALKEEIDNDQPLSSLYSPHGVDYIQRIYPADNVSKWSEYNQSLRTRARIRV